MQNSIMLMSSFKIGAYPYIVLERGQNVGNLGAKPHFGLLNMKINELSYKNDVVGIKGSSLETRDCN